MLTLFIIFIMRLFSKKAKEPISLEAAKRIATARYPERYEKFDIGGTTQIVDVNKMARVLYVSRLVGKSG